MSDDKLTPKSPASLSTIGAAALPRVNEMFEAAMRHRGAIVVQTGDDEYEITRDGQVLSVSLENVSKVYEQSGDAAEVERFVDAVFSLDIGEPTWAELKYRVYWMAQPAKFALENTFSETISKQLGKALVFTDPDEKVYTWVTTSHLQRWGVTEQQVKELADHNQDRLLEDKELEVSVVDGISIAMIPIGTALKASAIFAKSFRAKAQAAVGWPVFAVIPCRDFAYVYAQKDEALTSRLGGVVVREYRTSGYALTPEVLAIDDTGIKAIGTFIVADETDDETDA